MKSASSSISRGYLGIASFIRLQQREPAEKLEECAAENKEEEGQVASPVAVPSGEKFDYSFHVE